MVFHAGDLVRVKADATNLRPEIRGSGGKVLGWVEGDFCEVLVGGRRLVLRANEIELSSEARR